MDYRYFIVYIGMLKSNNSSVQKMCAKINARLCINKSFLWWNCTQLQAKYLCADHVILKGCRMMNLELNLECLIRSERIPIQSKLFLLS